jgi:hypothetical protein
MDVSDVRAAFAEYYKVERNRAEECLGDIIKILQGPLEEQAESILARMIRHYERS